MSIKYNRDSARLPVRPSNTTAHHRGMRVRTGRFNVDEQARH